MRNAREISLVPGVEVCSVKMKYVSIAMKIVINSVHPGNVKR